MQLRLLRACRLVAALTALAFAAAGCSYHSTYVPPADGRARVIWKSNDALGTEIAGAGPTELCQQEIAAVRERAAAARSAGRVYAYGPSSGEAWVPRYFGPPIIIVQPGLPPPFLRPPLFLPRLYRPMPAGQISGSGSLAVRGGGGGGGSGRGGGGGSSGGGDIGALAIVVLVIAVAVLPALALGYAASMPESASTSAAATDFVNAYNDLSRLSDTPCTPIWTPPALPAPPLMEAPPQ